jgi:hypothetical protein
MSRETQDSQVMEPEMPDRGFRLLDLAGAEEGVTVRDDQHEFSWLLDAAQAARRKGKRFRLVDSGKLDVFTLEWLAQAGADLYTSDEVRTDVAAVARIQKAGRPAGAWTIFFHYGEIGDAEKTGSLTLEMIKEMASSGIDLHISNKDRPRDPARLADIRSGQRACRAETVYYHHGRLFQELGDLVRAGLWVHISAAELDISADQSLLEDIRLAGRRYGGGLVVHVEKGLPRTSFEDIRRAGAYLIMNVPSGSAFSGRPLPPRAFYLDTTFLS